MAQSTQAVLSLASSPRNAETAVATSAVVRQLCHEIRQPLSTIESAAFYLQLIGHDDSRITRELDRIQQMAHQANWILSDVVHYTQAAASRAEWVDLAESVTGALSSSGSSKPAVEVQCADCVTPSLVRIDPAQAQHMTRTILNVFRQISRNGQPVCIALSRNNGSVVLRASCGADDRLCEFAEDLMTPFTPHLPAGSGLALASVQRIAEVHGGSTSITGVDGRVELTVVLPSH